MTDNQHPGRDGDDGRLERPTEDAPDHDSPADAAAATSPTAADADSPLTTLTPSQTYETHMTHVWGGRGTARMLTSLVTTDPFHQEVVLTADGVEVHTVCSVCGFVSNTETFADVDELVLKRDGEPVETLHQTH